MRNLFLILILQLSLSDSFSEIRLPKLISDGMVLQREQHLTIWGWSSPHELIHLEFSGKKYATTADSVGNWSLQLPPQKAGGPFTMLLKGNNEIQLKNILVGDVYLCSGQSNMELWMGRLKYKYPEELRHANNPNIRQFLVPDRYNFKQPATDVEEGAWSSVDSKSIFNFSGVAYFFAKELYEKYRIPIGIINAALGGSPIQAWISEEGLKEFPAYQNEGRLYKEDRLIRAIETREQNIQAIWYNYVNQFDLGHQYNWQQLGFGTASFRKVHIPCNWSEVGMDSFKGVLWLKKEVDIPATMLDKPAKLELGRVVDADSVFINGHFAGSTGYQYPPRRYELPANLLQSGKNTITIRVVTNAGLGGFIKDKRYELTAGSDTVDLQGEWQLIVGVQATAFPEQTFIRWKPFGLYNAMIAPLKNYSLKGIVWYQGESNVQKPAEYKNLLKTLVADWRAQWHQEQLPFLYIQLPNYLRESFEPEESNWAELREQQREALEIPNTSMVVAIDAGEWNDIHPEDKQVIGHRLALLAGRNIYKEKTLVASGPMLQSFQSKGQRVVLEFSETALGLVSKDGKPINQLAIAGEDKKFVWAACEIKGTTLEVWNDKVAQPVYIRYAWANNPGNLNLYNSAGLPAGPFQLKLAPAGVKK